jgi:hypothetical protein
MDKLRGVVAGLGMQVTVLALLWNTQYDPLPPVDGIEPAPVQISKRTSLLQAIDSGVINR